MAKKNIQNAQAIENNAIATANEKEEVTMAENTKAIETAEAFIEAHKDKVYRK